MGIKIAYEGTMWSVSFHDDDFVYVVCHQVGEASVCHGQENLSYGFLAASLKILNPVSQPTSDLYENIVPFNSIVKVCTFL